MKRIFTVFLLIVSFFLLMPTSPIMSQAEMNCFSIIVGKNASADGSVLVAHNEDDFGTQIVNHYLVPRQQHQPNATIVCPNGLVIPQVAETYGFIWLEMPGMEFSDSFINEWGVVVASDACASREDSPELINGGIKYWLRRLIAERARTAREGVKIAGGLISEYGYGSSGRTYIIADANEGWMLAAVHGKHWVAQRVPDDMVAVIPNYYTIGKINLSDTVNYCGSPDIIKYAIRRGWFEPGRDVHFHFAKAYSHPGNLTNNGNIHRMWRGVNLLADKNYQLSDEFPFAFKPKQKISIELLQQVLRDHYIGTELDKTDHYRLGNPYQMNGSTICASSTQYGFIAQLRNWLPVELGAVLWLAQHRPDCQAFIPWYLGCTQLPAGYALGNFQTATEYHFQVPKSFYERNDSLAFWTFTRLAEKVDEHYGQRIVRVQKPWTSLEKTLLAEQKAFEKKVAQIFSEDPARGRELLTEYTHKQATRAWEIARTLLDEFEKSDH
ncbi:MAG: C69 family dipeptidase [candidate division KSB1 bacterium]|nr:C69 family dipeptidase [candidate division KSB1 bacterium]MDZ7341848.1 C69 family dipeptidase [candidate division KSB1 bacterium]